MDTTIAQEETRARFRLSPDDKPIVIAIGFVFAILAIGTVYTLITQGTATLLSPTYLLQHGGSPSRQNTEACVSVE